jgi:uncharacterized protein YjiS (DUF1127 family)
MDTNENCPYFVPVFVQPRPSWMHRLSPARLFERLAFWSERASQRRQLARLDDRMLSDIGISRAEAYRESSKWFWQD